MSRTLGLDLGTNSIGWALVDDGKAVVATGVRIFPVGVAEEDFAKNGKEVSKNIARRMARGARRRRFRYTLRRQKLLKVLSENGMMPDDSDFFETRELYALRAKGLDRKLTLHEFGRILMMLNKRRGFKSNRKTAVDPDKKKEEGIVKEGIAQLHEEMEKAGKRTVGEYFYSLFEAADQEKKWPNEHTPIERIRDRFVGREMYEEEFARLWDKQARYYPEVLTSELRTKIGEETIFYQRNLRSQKGLVGKCRFEPSKQCAPRSSDEFQEYRIWQQLAVVRFIAGDRIGRELTPEEKQKACAVLMNRHKLTEDGLRKVLGLPRTEKFNDVFGSKGMQGNRTRADLADALGEETFVQLKPQHRFELWHVLAFTDNVEKLKNIIRDKISRNILPPLTEAQMDAFAELNLEEGYCNLSHKALVRVLPHLRKGLPLYDALMAAGYDPTKRILKGAVQEVTKLSPLKSNELRNPIVQQMLGESFRVINAIVAEYGKPDMIRVELARELKKPKKKREEARGRSIRKRALREEYAELLAKRLRKRVEPNSIEVKKYELWLEMGCTDPALDQLDSFLRDGRVSDRVKYGLWLECNRISPYSGKVIPISKLFSDDIQIEHILPYSKTMNNEFGNLCLCEAEINKKKGDKLPYEYFASLGEKELDAFKKRVSHLASEAKQRRFLAREIPEDFLNSQLINTSYAARELAWRLEMLLPPVKDKDGMHPRVQVVNGQATGTLRRFWGLNAILSMGDIDTKNRGDHRHHAIDAIVVACTTPALSHLLARYSEFDNLGRLCDNKKVHVPWKNFMRGVDTAINSIIISYRNNKRLIGSKLNKGIKTKNAEKYPKRIISHKSLTIRGPMHEETLYGSIERDGEQYFVSRWPLEKFSNEKQLEKVVDPKVREVLLKRVKKYGTVKKAFEPNEKDPVLMYSKKGTRVPIRHVRVINPGERLKEVRSGVFVETGNNYVIAIYEDAETKKREFETVPFYVAVERALKGEPIATQEKNGKRLLMKLKQRDIVVRYEEEPDEIIWDNIADLRKRLFRVRKFDARNGQVYLDYLYAAKFDDEEDRNILFFAPTAGTLKCIPVNVDILGRIHRE